MIYTNMKPYKNLFLKTSAPKTNPVGSELIGSCTCFVASTPTTLRVECVGWQTSFATRK